MKTEAIQRVYGGYVKATNPETCETKPIILRAESKEAALGVAMTEAYKHFPTGRGWTGHKWDVVEAIVFPAVGVAFSTADIPIEHSERRQR